MAYTYGYIILTICVCYVTIRIRQFRQNLTFSTPFNVFHLYFNLFLTLFD